MLTTLLKVSSSKIQKLLFCMIPESWDSIYLYASVEQHFGKLETGEMFFYYFPKGILKKNPVNSYEIPAKFQIEEEGYLELTKKLYDAIKELKEVMQKHGEKPWTHLTIKLENFRFMIEFYYDEMQSSPEGVNQRHILWVYENLKLPIESFTKQEQQIIRKYIEKNKHEQIEKKVYEEAMYRKPARNKVQYDREPPKYIEKEKFEQTELMIKNQILNHEKEEGRMIL